MSNVIHKWARYLGTGLLDQRHGTIGRTLCGFPVSMKSKETAKQATCVKCRDGNRLIIREESSRVMV